MKDAVFLVVTRNGVARMTKREPDLGRDEIGVRVKIEVPDNCFRSPILNASINVPEDRVIQPRVELEVEEHVAE